MLRCPPNRALVLLSLLAGGAGACTGGPTSDFPFTTPPGLTGGGTGVTGEYVAEDAGLSAPDQDAGSVTTGGEGGYTTGGALDAAVGTTGSTGFASDAGALDSADVCETDAGPEDASLDADIDADLDAANDAAPDPCGKVEGGTSADGSRGE